ncbi:MAG: FAD-dependent monooxygenase [Proteobacteria bacterium]|nr:FAD-dependent monooxygenase [Pseudomonadota bacterium]
MSRTDVLIVGAGPTGLVLGNWLARLGIPFRIIDKAAEAGTTSRALAVHARTLELYRQLDLTHAVVTDGHKVPAVNLWVRGKSEARVSFADFANDLTPYPFVEMFPQDEHEKLLIQRLKSFGIPVERPVELLSFTEATDRIIAQLHGPQGEETVEAAYIAGCDGARSTVRRLTGTGFPGSTYNQVFYVADARASGPSVNGEVNIDLDEADFLAVFPLKGTGRVRLIGTVRDERARHPESLTFADVSGRAIEHLKIQIDQVHWFSTYRVHHRVTDHFRHGRALLLGDAAHIHSPAGGQGMNTGIGDAINLAWKLAAVLKQEAPDELLDSYEAERIAFARKLVKTTDQIFSVATADGKIADLIRTRLAPLVIPTVTKVGVAREWLFRTVSQLMINYRDSELSTGRAGEVHGGDRLPWVKSADNFGPLREPTWQVHVYGTASAELIAWCAGRQLPLHVFDWSDAHGAVGFARNALYLLRPDTYVALAEASGAPEAIEVYFKDRGWDGFTQTTDSCAD